MIKGASSEVSLQVSSYWETSPIAKTRIERRAEQLRKEIWLKEGAQPRALIWGPYLFSA